MNEINDFETEISETEEELSDDTPEIEPAIDQFELKHLGEIKKVTRDEVIALAQKGMDYDRIRGRLDELSGEKDERRAEINRDLEQFAEEFPEAARDINKNVPREVWDAVNKGGTSLTAEFRKFDLKQKTAEIESLRAQLDTAKQNEKNKNRSTGSQSSGSIASAADIWDAAWNDD